MDESEQLIQWMKLWDQHAEELGRESAQQQANTLEKKQTSFFNDRPSTQDWQDKEELSDDYGWSDLISKADEHDYNLLNEEDGFKSLIKGGPTAKPTFQTNPQRFSSIGMDQQGEDGLTRVTKNWTSGDELLELDQVKKELERMERKVHESEVLKKNNKFEAELKSLRKRMNDLSEKMQSRPEDDVT